ncbi:factor-independent urate hydroxylase [Luteipulveratus mongoliensis]|uniref:Uricase n=1 Tax=Luteipulveratus mongoliensis TaxID=571913 RepID=A0A0K1JP16_9MICO|nr:urate oxidase [Luteipulveratus mongoliensis]AKU18456.1 urate oxidase [Luteipulveratus mongoliensis]
MTYVLGHNQYGKAEVRVVRIYRDADPHELVDYNVSVALQGDFTEAHTTGDQAKVLTTDACKNTVNALAKEHGDAARQPESFALALARHFVGDVPQVSVARVNIEAYQWDRAHETPHGFVRNGSYVRTTTVTVSDDGETVVSGLSGLTVLKTTDSEFHGFYQDKYTTLQPTNDRVMATEIKAQWLHSASENDWGASFVAVKDAITETFANAYSYALQHTLWEMGQAVLDAADSVAEVRFSCPNKHHFVIDLSPFGLDNPNEVFHADDRPYGLIEATIQRNEGPGNSAAFDPGQGW